MAAAAAAERGAKRGGGKQGVGKRGQAVALKGKKGGGAASPRGPLGPDSGSSNASESGESAEAGAGARGTRQAAAEGPLQVEVEHGGKTVVTPGRRPNKRAIRQLQELRGPGSLTGEDAAEVLAACEGDVAQAAEALVFNRPEAEAKREEWHHPPLSAPPFPKKPSAAAGGRREAPPEGAPLNEIFVKGLDGSWGVEGTVRRIHEIFGDCGTILNVRVPPDRRPEREGCTRGFAIVRFAEPEARAAAGPKQNEKQAGRWIKVDTQPELNPGYQPPHRALERRDGHGPQAVDSSSRFHGRGGLTAPAPASASGGRPAQAPPVLKSSESPMSFNGLYEGAPPPAGGSARLAGPGNEARLESMMVKTRAEKEELRRRMVALEERERQMLQQSDIARRSRALRALQHVERSLQDCLTMARANHESLARRQSRSIKDEFGALRELLDERESAMLAEVEACRQADSRELFGAQQALLQLGGPACVEGLQAIPRERFQTLMTEMERQGQQVRQSFLGEQVVLGTQGVQFKNCDEIRGLISAHGHVERADTTAAARLTAMPGHIIQAHQSEPLSEGTATEQSAQGEPKARSDLANASEDGAPMNFAGAAKKTTRPTRGPEGQTVAPPPPEARRDSGEAGAPNGPLQVDLGALLNLSATNRQASKKAGP